MEKSIKETFDSLSTIVTQGKANLAAYDRTLYLKLNDVFKEIKKYPLIQT